MSEERIQALIESGVKVVDPRQLYVDEKVDLSRIRAGAVLHPGTRLCGNRCYVGDGAEVGSEGPATLKNSVLASASKVASGYVEGTVLLEGASLGGNTHARPGTLLEEKASTAHAVGLKQSLLLSFVTLGSLINFCDVLMSGGRSRSDHSEVGSGFIHFNFTPWGQRGDKATPSLIGDVPHGVFLRQDRIFLGGSSGLVGPGRVGFGSVTGAGQVVRREVPEKRMRLEATPEVDREFEAGAVDPPLRRRKRNTSYIGNLVALREWYRQVRLLRAMSSTQEQGAGDAVVLGEAIKNIDLCIQERIRQLNRFLDERDERPVCLEGYQPSACPFVENGQIEIGNKQFGHLDWLEQLSEKQVVEGSKWLEDLVSDVQRHLLHPH